jgi:ribosomal protein S18 acetylase RimI-like enzyme
MIDITFRRATREDLPAIVALLSDDALGQTREDASLPLAQSYLDAFAAIDADPNQYLAVVEAAGRVIGTLQLTFLPNISRKGAWRAQIEAVRIDASVRGEGLGRRMFDWSFEQARQRGCALVQLTSDHAREEAHRFYESLGFTAGHLGFKKAL